MGKMCRRIKKLDDRDAKRISEELYKVSQASLDHIAAQNVAAMLWVLHSDFGFGGTRLERLYKKFVEFFATMNFEKISPKDVFDMLIEETGFDTGKTAVDTYKELKPQFIKRRVATEGPRALLMEKGA